MSMMSQVLKNTQAFSTFSDEELSQLVEFCEEQNLPKGTVIFQEGQKDDSAVYFVQEGDIQIIKGSADDPMVLAEFGMGNIFGEMSFLDLGPRSASAITARDSVIFKLTPDQFFEYGAKVPRAAMKMFKVFIAKLVRRLRDTDEALLAKNKQIITS